MRETYEQARDRYLPLKRSLIRKFDRRESDEVAADVDVGLWKGWLKGFPPHGARWYLHNRERDLHRQVRRLTFTDEPMVGGTSPSHEEAIVFQVAVQQIGDRLEGTARDCLRLLTEGLSKAEVADRFGISEYLVEKMIAEKIRPQFEAAGFSAA